MRTLSNLTRLTMLIVGLVLVGGWMMVGSYAHSRQPCKQHERTVG